MDKQFYICHSSRDIGLAEALLEELEANGYKCWIASRDAESEANSEKSINSAILNSSAVLLIFTENTSDSRHIRSELDIAAHQRIPILSLKFSEGDISESISYYTDSQQWVDCISLQANTPEIRASLINLTKEPVEIDHLQEDKKKKPGWVVPAILAFIVILVLPLLLCRSPQRELDGLMNTAVGGRETQDYASDMLQKSNGSFVVCGAWDWGYGSKVWVVHFDNTSNIVSIWSDSVSGDSKPLLLPTLNNGCIAVYSDLSEATEVDFAFRTTRFDSNGNVMRETVHQVPNDGTSYSTLTSICWLPDSKLFASFQIDKPENREQTASYAILGTSRYSLDCFQLQDNVDFQTMTASEDGRILFASRNEEDGFDLIKVIDLDGSILLNTLLGEQRKLITHVSFTTDNSVLVVFTSRREKGTLSIAKYTEDFELVWENSFNEDVRGTVNDLSVHPDGRIFLAGSTTATFGEEADGKVICLDSSGEMLWESIVDTGADDHIYAVESGFGENLLLSGTTTFFGDQDAWFIEMTLDGEYNETCKLGIDLFTESWESGLIDQSEWEVRVNDNNAPVVSRDVSGSSLAMCSGNALLVTRKSIELATGVVFSAEITVLEDSEVSGNGSISIGTSKFALSALLQRESQAPDTELNWLYSPEEVLTASVGRVSPCSTITFHESLLLVRSEPQLFAIENFEDSVAFRVNDSLISVMPSCNEPDSLHFTIRTNSSSVQHSVDNIRIYRRQW